MRTDMRFGCSGHPAWFLAILGAFAVAMVLIGHTLFSVDTLPIADLTRHYAIPPTFGHSRLLYASTLALMLTMSLMAFGGFIENVRFLVLHNSPWRYPAKVTVVNETILFVAVLLTIVPDVIGLFSWGELTAPPYALLSKWNRALDGLAGLCFMLYAYRRLRSRPTLLFQLQREPIPVDLEPKWEQLRPKVLIVLAVAVISFGVAFAK